MRLISEHDVVQRICAVRDAIPRELPTQPSGLGVKCNRAGDIERGALKHALRCIHDSPTVDAVVVTRCEDCVFGKRAIEIAGVQLVECHSDENPPYKIHGGKFFCAFGMSKEEHEKYTGVVDDN